MFPRACVPWVWYTCLWVCACVSAVCPPCPHAATPAPPRCQERGSTTADECFYRIANTTDFYYSTAAKYFGLECVSGLTLEEDALPVFPARGAVPSVTLQGCGAPAGGRSYREALARLNLTVLDRLTLLQLPPSPPLQRTHFHHLASLRHLHITAGSQPINVQDTEATIFAPLTNLTSLTLSGVHLSAGVLASINSTSVESVSLTNCGLESLEAEWLCSLRALRRLAVRDGALQRLPSACSLTTLTLRAPSLSRLPPLHTVVELILTMKEAVTLEKCESLKNLSVSFTAARALPEGWLSECGALEVLRLWLPRVSALAATALAGLPRLTHLTINSGHRFQELPSGLFLDTRNIHTLALSNNNLTELPSDLLAPLWGLRSLELSRCGFTPPALAALAGLPLRHLSLNHNALGDTCPSQSNTFLIKQRSKLATLSELEELSLRNTGSTRICPDWRDLPRLRTLDLRDNNITELTWADFKWRQREHPTEVLLANNPLTAVVVSQAEYDAATPPDNTVKQVKFVLDQESNQPLRCDCYMYWFAKALGKGSVGVRFENLCCLMLEGRGERGEEYCPKDSVPIDLMPTKNMECPLPGACPSNCSCAVSPERRGAVLRCGGDGGGGLPDLSVVAGGLQPGDRLVLEAAGAGLRTLPPSLPPALQELDLRHNQLREAEEGAGRALFAGGRRVLLGGNPIDCTCTQPLLAHIAQHLTQVEDKTSVQCADETNIVDAVRTCIDKTPGWWGRGAVWGAAGGGAMALVLGAAALLGLRRAVRLRLKAFLLARGLCLRWAKPNDDKDYKYDVFISYAHEDSAVADELVTVLEGTGLRACVHHRDWAPGDWIPHQIAMSVARSRRTMALLSTHFLQSGWARAEFREAYGRALREGSTRLIVVVLGETPPKGLDREMQHYVSNNTYLRWGEPAFWEKLKVALPQPRAAPPAPSPARGTNPVPSDQATDTQTAPPASQPHTQSPPTMIVKFADMNFPTLNKPLRLDPLPCV